MKNEKVSVLQMTLTIVLVICLILSNILVIKPIDLFGIPALSTTCGIVMFPITYILSDVFSEVYGYKWSRITANWAFIGTALTSIMFAFMIAIQGNSSWDKQEELVNILGNTPLITVASILAFWLGDWANDKIFQKMKQKHKDLKGFGARAILSSFFGKYVDRFAFVFLGLHFLPLETKIIMVLNAPFMQVGIELLLLPLTIFVANKVKKAEGLEDVSEP